MCNHPDLITGAASDNQMYPPADELAAACGKLALLERLLTRLRAGGHRVLIFSQVSSGWLGRGGVESCGGWVVRCILG